MGTNYKKIEKKVDFLKISKEEQGRILREALIKGQEGQKELEKKYYKTLLKASC